MRRRLPLIVLLCAALAAPLAVSAAPPAASRAACETPAGSWGQLEPDKAALDAGKLQQALDFATSRQSTAVRVYRFGCLVGADRFAELNEALTFESFSMAKSVTSMLVGRAVTLGKLRVDDEIGRYLPEADAAHGALTVRHLLTMTSGLHWNFFRDYNITPKDRVADALSLPFDREPGTWFEYAQSPVTLLAKVVERAVGADLMEFAQAELFAPIGVAADAWTWERDGGGNVAGYYGVRTTVDTWARLGELLRRGGRWDGRQLIAPSYLSEAVRPTRTNPGYGFLFWLNGTDYVIAPTIYSRDVSHERMVPSAPRDMYSMNGLQQQRVYVIPSLDMVVVRAGVSANREPDTRATVFTSRSGQFEHEFFRLLMRAVKDVTVQDPGPYANEPHAPVPDPYYGIGRSAQEADDWRAASPLPSS